MWVCSVYFKFIYATKISMNTFTQSENGYNWSASHHRRMCVGIHAYAESCRKEKSKLVNNIWYKYYAIEYIKLSTEWFQILNQAASSYIH